jgi:hypothetical protein
MFHFTQLSGDTIVVQTPCLPIADPEYKKVYLKKLVILLEQSHAHLEVFEYICDCLPRADPEHKKACPKSGQIMDHLPAHSKVCVKSGLYRS